jgi:nitroimidazol reductase NimA-like FMN-containing flavoprotein (pyridoxamine 5'-phosphate oxidase superfamily)
MSNAPQVRRTDRLMPDDRIHEMLAHGYAGRLGSTGADGWPYVVPLLYVWLNGEIWLHNTGARGHLRANIEHEPRVCFEIDDPGEVFAYGRFECDSSVAYRSVVAFGRARIVEEPPLRTAFFDALMAKYADPNWERPKNFYPRLREVTIYAITVERMTGKELPLPAPQERWPAVDRTKSPRARPPDERI